MQKKINTTSSGGYAILFAVLLVSIILAITLGVLNIAIKEFNFTATAKNSHISFFAADTGGECALYGRKQGMLTQASPAMLCDTQTIVSTAVTVATGITRFDFTPISVQAGCAVVDIVVDNTDSLITRTTINSHGYNVACGSVNTAQNKVERLLSFEFTEGNSGGIGGTTGTGATTGTTGTTGGVGGTTLTPLNPTGTSGSIQQNFGTSGN